MKDKYGNRFRYSNKMHIKRTKRLKYQKLLQNYKDKNNISRLESELSIFNGFIFIYIFFHTYIINQLFKYLFNTLINY